MAQSCDFTCSGSKVKNTANRSCDTAGPGKFIVSGLEKSCATGSNMDLASRKGSKWASSQPEVQTAADCKLATCSGTHVFTDTSKTRCRALITGEYQKTDHTEGSCVAIANSQFTSDGGASNTGCTYTCTAGFVDGRHDNPATRGPAQHRLQDITQTATGRQKHALRDKRPKRITPVVRVVAVARSRRQVRIVAMIRTQDITLTMELKQAVHPLIMPHLPVMVGLRPQGVLSPVIQVMERWAGLVLPKPLLWQV